MDGNGNGNGHSHVILPLVLRDVDDELLWPRRSRTRSSCLPRDGATYDDRLLYPLCGTHCNTPPVHLHAAIASIDSLID